MKRFAEGKLVVRDVRQHDPLIAWLDAQLELMAPQAMAELGVLKKAEHLHPHFESAEGQSMKISSNH